MWRNEKLKYTGQFRNGLFHGQGILHNHSGIYEGDFKKGMMTGKGMMDFYNGDKYTGEFLNSSITGYGCYLTHEGTKLIGYFDDGVCNKHGKKIGLNRGKYRI